MTSRRASRAIHRVAGLSLMLALAGWARAEDTEKEIWNFSNGELTRSVDVTTMPPEVRAAVLQRLERDGFRRLRAETAGSSEPGESTTRRPGKAERRLELERLVRHGGRFPPARAPLPWPQDLRALGRAWERLDRAAQRDPEVAAAVQVLRPLVRAVQGAGRSPGPDALAFLGAEGVLDAGPGPGAGAGASASALRLRQVPAGSLAAAVGLVRGDRILAVDERSPSPAACAAWARPEDLAGQRTLVVERTVGRIEHWRLTLRPGTARPEAGPPAGS